MTRVLRWILLVVILGGGAYLGLAVDFGGGTLLDRVLGRKPPQASQEAPAPEGDRLTEEDRQGLDRLIKTRLEEKQAGKPGP